MTKRTTIGLTIIALLITANVVLLIHRHSRQAAAASKPQPTRTVVERQPVAPTTPAATLPKPAVEPAAPAARPAQTAPIQLDGAVDLAKRATVVAVQEELRALYSDVGTLSWDDTKALIAKRRKASEDLVDRLAKLGSGGARAIASVYTATDDTRTKLLLVAALGRTSDQEATAVLDGLMGGDNSFSLRKEMVAALGQRQEPASGAVLTGILQNQDDARLRAMSVQGLSGRAEALPVLTERISNDTSSDVRMESIRSIGRIGNPAARDVLAGLAKGSTEVALRQTAIQELGRSFGESALEVFDSLLSDPNESIRQSTVKGIARVHTDGAVALLSRAAASDSSSVIRELARLSLPSTP